MGLSKHDVKKAERASEWCSLTADDWMRFPFGPAFDQWMAKDAIRVDEYRENGSLVIKAELPGIDPQTDVAMSVSGRLLHIEAERRQEEKTEDKGYVRQEFRYGSFVRTLPLPEGVSAADIKASYKDGIFEIRVPAPEPMPAREVSINKG